MRLYPVVKVKQQDLSREKVVTIPDQSMSLAEIIRRFTRKESLPIEKEGTYEHRFGDLEKLKHEDLVVQEERIQEIKGAVKRHNKKVADLEQAEAVAAAEREKVPKEKPPVDPLE